MNDNQLTRNEFEFNSDPSKPLNRKTLLGYGVGNLGYGMVLQAMTIYLVFFGTTLLKIPGSVLGIIISMSVIWDAISDPIMGSISDYTRSKRFGRRHLYILIGSVGVAFFNAILWTLNENWSLNTKIILVVIIVIGVKTFSTVFVTPYLALSGELSEDYYERTTIQSIRTIFLVLGMAFTVVVGMTYFLRPTVEFPMGQLNRSGYMYLGFSISIIMIISGLITYFSTKKYIPLLQSKIHKDHQGEKPKVIPQLKVDFKELSSNRNYFYVCLAYLSANTASAIIGSVGLHVFTFTFRLDSLTIGIVFGSLFIFMILSQPFWIKYSRKEDKRNAAIVATIIGIVACIVFLMAVVFKNFVVANPYMLLPFSALAGFSVGGLLTLPLSMVGDTIDIEEAHTGRRSEGLYYGGITFSYKASQAIAIFIVGVLLDMSGFDPDLTLQMPSTEIILGLILSIGSLLAFTLTLYAYYRYNLSHNDIVEIRKKSKEKQNDKKSE